LKFILNFCGLRTKTPSNLNAYEKLADETMTGTNGKKVLVVGNGGREHVLCWKLAQSAHVDVVYSLPASPGIQQVEKVRAVEGVNVADFTVS
jgi:Phosphoribosylglycinamide synthetase, N domain